MKNIPQEKPLPCHHDRQCRILLVEDRLSDQDLLRIFVHIYGEDGFILIVRPTLKQAIEEIKAHDVDLILLDLSLPDSEGLATLAAIVALRPKAPIIVQSGVYDSHEDCILMGAQDYFIKGEVTGRALIDLLRKSILRNQVRNQILQQVEALKHLEEYISRADLTTTAPERSKGMYALASVIDELKQIAGKRY